MTNAPLDKIYIRDLLSRCIIGIYPEERVAKQEVIFNITLHARLSRAAETDCINDTVDYKSIKKRIFEMAEASEFQLIETLADRAAKICLEAPGVERVEVSVDKPGALRFARSVAVAIVRERDGSGEAG
jgi:dihydroneopterin aldolase/D-erythro-7,8-dihydroneopterin triphosphate epimerase